MDDSERLAFALKGLSVLRHDVRNLMASAQIIVERMEKSDDERLRKSGPMLLDSMQRTVELGVAAGQLASVAVTAPAAVPLAAAAARVLDAVGVTAGVRTEGLGEHAVRAEPQHVDRMLEALVMNGLALGEAGGGTGGVTFEAARDAEAIKLTARCAGEVPGYAREKLLVPYGGARRRGGTGLGLPIARFMAEENGGSLALAETGEAGTVFVLRLPAA